MYTQSKKAISLVLLTSLLLQSCGTNSRLCNYRHQMGNEADDNAGRREKNEPQRSVHWTHTDRNVAAPETKTLASTTTNGPSSTLHYSGHSKRKSLQHTQTPTRAPQAKPTHRKHRHNTPLTRPGDNLPRQDYGTSEGHQKDAHNAQKQEGTAVLTETSSTHTSQILDLGHGRQISFTQTEHGWWFATMKPQKAALAVVLPVVSEGDIKASLQWLRDKPTPIYPHRIHVITSSEPPYRDYVYIGQGLQGGMRFPILDEVTRSCYSLGDVLTGNGDKAGKRWEDWHQQSLIGSSIAAARAVDHTARTEARKNIARAAGAAITGGGIMRNVPGFDELARCGESLGDIMAGERDIARKRWEDYGETSFLGTGTRAVKKITQDGWQAAERERNAFGKTAWSAGITLSTIGATVATAGATAPLGVATAMGTTALVGGVSSAGAVAAESHIHGKEIDSGEVVGAALMGAAAGAVAGRVAAQRFTETAPSAGTSSAAEQPNAGAKPTSGTQPKAAGNAKPGPSAQPKATGSAKGAGNSQPKAAGSTRTAGNAQPKATGSAKGAGNAQPKAAGSTRTAGNAQPKATGSAKGAGNAQPKAAGSTRTAGNAQPKATGSAKGAGNAQPKAAGSTRTAGNAQPKATGSAKGAGNAQPKAAGNAKPGHSAQPKATGSAKGAGNAQPKAAGITRTAGNAQPKATGSAKGAGNAQPKAAGNAKPGHSAQPKATGSAKGAGNAQPKAAGITRTAGNAQPKATGSAKGAGNTQIKSRSNASVRRAARRARARAARAAEVTQSAGVTTAAETATYAGPRPAAAGVKDPVLIAAKALLRAVQRTQNEPEVQGPEASTEEAVTLLREAVAVVVAEVGEVGDPSVVMVEALMLAGEQVEEVPVHTVVAAAAILGVEEQYASARAMRLPEATAVGESLGDTVAEEAEEEVVEDP